MNIVKKSVMDLEAGDVVLLAKMPELSILTIDRINHKNGILINLFRKGEESQQKFFPADALVSVRI